MLQDDYGQTYLVAAPADNETPAIPGLERPPVPLQTVGAPYHDPDPGTIVCRYCLEEPKACACGDPDPKRRTP